MIVRLIEDVSEPANASLVQLLVDRHEAPSPHLTVAGMPEGNPALGFQGLVLPHSAANCKGHSFIRGDGATHPVPVAVSST